MLRGANLVAVLLLFCAFGQNPGAAEADPGIHIGSVTFIPTGFIDLIGEVRSRASTDTVNTRLASTPLYDSDPQAIGSVAHSRVALHGDVPLGSGVLTGYIETDFLQPRGRTPWRWRQFWGEYRIGRWRILGGQAWSLLRPNRFGLTSETDLMNTLVVEPAYHVGLIGMRHEQLRITYDVTSNSHIAAEWESRGLFLGRFAQDRGRLHWDAMAFGGTRGRRGGALGNVIPVGDHFRVAGEVAAGRGLGPEMLGILPGRGTAVSVLEGFEAPVTPVWTIFGYAGVIRGDQSRGAENRFERQWTAGVQRRIRMEDRLTATLSAQVSQIERSISTGAQGRLTYVMASLRINLPEFRRRETVSIARVNR